MGRLPVHVLVLVSTACGGGGKSVAKPTGRDTKPAPTHPDTEADREQKRHAAALAIVPEGSKCLPVALKSEGAPQLQLAAIGKDPILCAIDTDKSRALGPVGCWKVDVTSGALDYQEPQPLPGHGFVVKLDDHCARGYCVPGDAKGTALIAWNLDGSKVAMLAGDDVHLFDAKTKQHQSAFSIRGDKGVPNDPIGLSYVGDQLFVEGADQGASSAVWQLKEDGTKVGPLVAIGVKDGKPISTWHGTFSVLDPTTVGISERGMENLHTLQVETGARAKLVRKIGKLACKPEEVDAYWHDGDKVTDTCRETIQKNYGYLLGATAVAGSKSFLVLLHGARLGELGVFDKKSLAENEKKLIKLPWCDAK
jgi:hypothetical protein